AQDAQWTVTPEITCMLTLCETRPTTNVLLIHSPIPDECFLSADIWEILVRGLMECMATKHRLLVHCRLGKSRSPALVAAYLARIGFSDNPESALAYVTGIRDVVAVHPETWRGVQEWWDR